MVHGLHVYAGNRCIADGYDNPNSFYDARLIAAAPDMLDALKIALRFVDAIRRVSGGDGDATALQIRDAIQKATGSQAYE
jgi:hypothetical protein